MSKEKIKKAKLDSTKQKTKLYTRNQILFVSGLGYILFFVPLIFCRNEPFARFHANQALIMWMFFTILYLSFAFIPNVNIIAVPLILLFHVLSIIFGISSVTHSKAKPIFLIGHIKLIKWDKVKS